MRSFTTIIFCLVIPVSFSNKGVWYYRAQNEWLDLCNQGQEQSPIWIETKNVRYNESLKVTHMRYDTDYRFFKIINNGKTIQLTLDEKNHKNKKAPILNGPALDNKSYVFHALHFHWSDKYMNGSEHRIDGRRHEMEMHLVHYNKLYGNIAVAMKHRDGLAVVALLFEVKDEDNIALKPIIRGVISVSEENNGVYNGNPAHYPIRLINLFPNGSSLFYRYHGSLTTPGCDETVTWLIYDSTINISEAQFMEFENLWDREGQKMTSTYRAPQPLNGRIVECSEELNKKESVDEITLA